MIFSGLLVQKRVKVAFPLTRVFCTRGLVSTAMLRWKKADALRLNYYYEVSLVVNLYGWSFVIPNNMQLALLCHTVRMSTKRGAGSRHRARGKYERLSCCDLNVISTASLSNLFLRNCGGCESCFPLIAIWCGKLLCFCQLAISSGLLNIIDPRWECINDAGHLFLLQDLKPNDI